MGFDFQDELIFLGSAFFALSLSLLSFKLGRKWMAAYVAFICAVLACVSAKFSNVFGLPVGMGEAIFGCLFLSTDMTVERYGKKAGLELAFISFSSLLLFNVFTQLSLVFSAHPDVLTVSEAMDTLFSFSLRVTIAGAIVYLLAQIYDIYIYELIRSKTKGRFLWLRNNVSTISTQFFNVFIFYFLAFYGVYENWLEFALAGFIAMSFVAIMDTPMMYLSKRIKPLDEK